MNLPEKENLEEVVIDKNHSWCDKRIQDLDLPENVLIALIKRGDESLIPDGGTLYKKERCSGYL